MIWGLVSDLLAEFPEGWVAPTTDLENQWLFFFFFLRSRRVFSYHLNISRTNKSEFRKVPDAGLKIYVKLGDLRAKLADQQVLEAVCLLHKDRRESTGSFPAPGHFHHSRWCFLWKNMVQSKNAGLKKDREGKGDVLWVQVRSRVPLCMWISYQQVYWKKREEEAWRIAGRRRQFYSWLTGRKLGDPVNRTPSLLDLFIPSLRSLFMGEEWYMGRAFEEITNLMDQLEKYWDTTLWWDRAMSRINWETNEQSMSVDMWCHRHVMPWTCDVRDCILGHIAFSKASREIRSGYLGHRRRYFRGEATIEKELISGDASQKKI